MTMTLQSWVLLLLLSLIWGASFLFIEMSLQGFEPLTIAFLRVSISSFILLTFLYKKLPRDWQLWKIFILMGLINNTIPFTLIIWGQVHMTSSMASIMNATAPIFGAVFAHLFTQDEKLIPRKALGVFIGFIGVTITMLPRLQEGFDMQGWGQAAGLGAACFYALSSVVGKRLSETPPIINMTCMMLSSSVMLLPIVLYIDGPITLPSKVIPILSVLILSVFCTAIAFLLYFRILAQAGATNLLLVTFIMPVVALTIGAHVLNEDIHPTSLYGMLAIFCGLICIDERIFKRMFCKPVKGKTLS